MTSKITNFLGVFLVLNLAFFSLVSSCGNSCGSGSPYSKPNPKPSPGRGSPGSGRTPRIGGSPGSGGGGGFPGSGGSPGTGGSPSTGGTCPIDALKLGVCANVLNGLLNITIGTPPRAPCCSLLQGLVDAEVAVCLCTAIRANILGINLNVPLSISLLANYCGHKVPRGFQCP